MRKILLTCSLFVMALSVLADPIDIEKARQLAASFMADSNSKPTLVKRAQRKNVSGRRLAQRYQQVSPYYVFSNGDEQGFVIVSGDDALPEVLGYTQSGNFDETDMPPFLKWYLEYCGGLVEAAQAEEAPRMQTPMARAAADRENIAPLIATHWHQTAPYNNMAPTLKSNGNRAVTGCVATATSQILYYWRKDISDVMLKAVSSYTAGDQANATKAFAKGTQIKWDLMRTSYTGSEPSEYNDAVATLMAVCGGSAHLTYGNETGGYPADCIPTFRDIFGMNGGSHRYKNYEPTNVMITDESWAKLIYDDLAKSRPVLYAGCQKTGTDSYAGHCVVVDGYQVPTSSTPLGLFHINMGWGNPNYYDGYFYLASGHSKSWSFSDGWVEAVTGVYPKTQNLDVDFGNNPDVYVNRPAEFVVDVANNGTLDYSGVYFFANSTGKAPTALSEAKDKDVETVLLNDGKTVRLKFKAKPTNKLKWHFYVTDKNLNVLAKTSAMPQQAPNEIFLKDMVAEGSSDTEIHNGQEYSVFYSNKASALVDVEDRSHIGYDGTLRMYLYESEDDGQTFNYTGYKTVKTTIEPGKSTQVRFQLNSTTACPITAGKLYYGILPNPMPSTYYDDVVVKDYAADTIVRFVLKEGELVADSYIDNCLKLKGVWDVSNFFTLVKKSNYKTATSYDLTEVTNIGNVPLIDLNPNALVYVADDSPATGRNVVRNGVCNRLEIQPGYVFEPKADFKAETAIFDLNIPADSWQLVTVPCDLTVPKGIVARTIDSHSTSGISSKTTNVHELKAGHTFLFMAASSDHQELTGKDANVSSTIVANPDTAVVGSYRAMSTPKGAFLPNSASPQYFDIVDEGTVVEPLRGYFYAKNVTKSFRAYSLLTTDPTYLTLANNIENAYKAIETHRFFATEDMTNELLVNIDTAEVWFAGRDSANAVINAYSKKLTALVNDYVAASPVPHMFQDFTSFIQNPSFESGITGWTTSGVYKLNSDLKFKSVGCDGSRILYNCDSEKQASATSQIITGLPMGYYRVSAKVGSTEKHDITLYAGDTAVVVRSSDFGEHYLVEAAIDNVFVGESGELEIGIKAGYYYKADDFRLTLLEAVAPTVPADVNGDGSVDTQDVLLIYDFMQTAAEGDKIGSEDVNGDGSVDTQDVLEIYDYMQKN